jgi:hypothetical protein
MSWYSDGENVGKWYLEMTGDGNSYPDEEREDEEYDD